MTVPCRHCKALVKYVTSEATGKRSVLNLSGTIHNCKAIQGVIPEVPKFLPLGEDL